MSLLPEMQLVLLILFSLFERQQSSVNDISAYYDHACAVGMFRRPGSLSCYGFSKYATDWEWGVKSCLKRRSHLAIFEDPGEVEFVNFIWPKCVGPSCNKQIYWIGMRFNGGYFEWFNDFPFLNGRFRVYWAKGYPNTYGKCVAATFVYGFILIFNAPCHQPYRYICEQDLTPDPCTKKIPVDVHVRTEYGHEHKDQSTHTIKQKAHLNHLRRKRKLFIPDDGGDYEFEGAYNKGVSDHDIGKSSDYKDDEFSGIGKYKSRGKVDKYKKVYPPEVRNYKTRRYDNNYKKSLYDDKYDSPKTYIAKKEEAIYEKPKPRKKYVYKKEHATDVKGVNVVHDNVYRYIDEIDKPLDHQSYFAHPYYPNKYIYCSPYGKRVLRCPDYMFWNQYSQQCDILPYGKRAY